jgi:MFS family permease
MMIPVGLLYDRFPIRRLLVIALTILALGNVMFASMTNWYGLLAARLFMGFGSAFAFVGVLVIIRTWFPSRLFALLVGLTQLMAALGAMMGETPVAALVHSMGWRYASFLFAFIAVLLACLVFATMREPIKTKTLLNWPLIRASLKTLFKNTQTYWVACFAFLSWGPVVIYAELWGSTFLQTLYGVSIAKASVGALMMWIGIAISAPILGYLNQRYSNKSLMTISMLIALVASMFLIYGHHVPYWLALVLSFPLGIGAGAQILSFDLVRLNNPGDSFGIGTGFNNFGVVLGGALLQPIVSVIMQLHTVHTTAGPHYTVTSFTHALWLIPACFLMGALLSLFIIRYKNN